MAIDAHAQRHGLPLGGLGNARLLAAVDDAVRQMEQEIDDARLLTLGLAEQLAQGLGGLRADAGERADRAEQGGQEGRAHRV